MAAASLFFPIARVEVGGSFQRQFEGDGSRDNQYGLDMTWQANAVPIDVRGEYVRNAERGSGYWVEGAYRLRRVRVRESADAQFTGRVQGGAVLRS